MKYRRTLVLSGLILAMLLTLGGCRSSQPERTWNGEPLPRKTQPTVAQDQQLVEAQQAMDAGEYEYALTLFQEILAENPTITTAYLGIGDIYMIKQDYGNAEPAYSRACRLEPKNFDAQYGHGLSLQMLERFIEAIRAYQRALGINPQSFQVHLNLAICFLQADMVKHSVTHAEEAVRLDPANGPARVNLGAVYENMGRTADAIEQYLIASELMETGGPLTMNLINALAKEKRYQETVNAAENLIKIEPSANAYERIGWAQFKLRDYEKSIEAYRKAIEMDPEHWPSLNGIGVNSLNTWLLSGKTNHEASLEARDAFRRSLRINPEQPKVISLLLNYNL